MLEPGIKVRQQIQREFLGEGRTHHINGKCKENGSSARSISEPREKFLESIDMDTA